MGHFPARRCCIMPLPMSTLLRRSFLAGTAALPAALHATDLPSSPRIWIDPRQAALPSRPWRKIHLDFHNSQYIARIGERFNADEFGDRLLQANVDSIVVFAKDMHGYFYYPSAYGPVHPGLSFDLLGPQVAACRKRKIAVYAYYCTTWDNYLAEKHPEWLVMKRDRTSYLPKFDQTPGWTALCLAHNDFVDLVLQHTREFVSRYELDGAWFDMPIPIGGECYCSRCLELLRARHLDPFDKRVQREHKQALLISFLDRATRLVRQTRPGCQVDYNNQCTYGLAERVPFMDNIDIEALPTAGWGYYYFPTLVRFTRTSGLTSYGMTGRFHFSWADFGGLKQPVQLSTELASIVANGARCDIGDQMHPSGRLDPAVYHVIGKAYGQIKALEPYLEQAVPVTEAALLIGGLPLDGPEGPSNFGLSKLLIESRVQFDVIESSAPWERYALVILGESLPVDAALAARLHTFVRGGGAVLVSDRSGLLAGTGGTWLEPYGLHYAGPSPFKPAYLLPQTAFTGDIPPFEYALYEGASQWRASSPAQVLATLGEPAFQRSPEHYTSHAQTPFDHATDYAAMARSGSVALFGFPLGASYFNRGYWVYRQAFQRVLKDLLPTPIIETDAPMSTEVTVTHQAARADIGRRERYLVHVINFSALRRAPQHPDYYDDPIPLTDVHLRLRLPLGQVAARALVADRPLDVRRASGGVEVTLARVPVHEVICLEL
jgi:hypothetical protein